MESVFKYIFALIVGAMFILFFVGFARNYIIRADTVDANVLVSGFDDYLMLLSGSTDSTVKYDFGAETAIQFSRGELKSGTNAKRPTNRIVFAPNQLKGKKLIIWTKRWSFPYPIDNFFYMTNEKYKQLIISDDDTAGFVSEFVDEINDTFAIDPPKKKDLLTAQNLATMASAYRQYSNVRFLAIVKSPLPANTVSNIKRAVTNADVVSVIIEKDEESGNNEWKDYGTIKFEDREMPFIGREMILGAMFTESPDEYRFNFNRAMQRLMDITDIYQKKAEIMSPLDQTKGCQYGLFSQSLAGYKSKADEIAGDETISRDTIALLAQQAKGMDENDMENFGGECPAVFSK
ncbi:MAG TPA: hypothetical protein HA362_05195 [Nanoarchaeota archaeon]|nr:hypothetical protein [Nanoarchaeota archaeon]